LHFIERLESAFGCEAADKLNSLESPLTPFRGGFIFLN